MKPNDVELCSVSYHAGRMGEDAHAIYWMECSGIKADHLRRNIRENLGTIAGLFGLKVVEIEDDDTCSECGGSSKDLTEFQGSYLCEYCTREEAEHQQAMHEMAQDDLAHAKRENVA